MEESSSVRYKALAALQCSPTTADDLSTLSFQHILRQPLTVPSTDGCNSRASPQPVPTSTANAINEPDEDAGDNCYVAFETEDLPSELPSPTPPQSPILAPAHEPPWAVAAGRHNSHLLQLHNELVSLYSYLTPTATEVAARDAAVQRVEEVVKSIWPEAQVAVFGSYATDAECVGLYLPTSDIDVVVLGSSAAKALQDAQRALAAAVSRRGLAKNVVVISKAKVPLVKFDDVQSGVSIDVSFDVANGPEAASITKELMQELPPMRPLVMLLKVFLQQRELNEVYSGGLGSYALMVLVAAFLANHPSRGRASNHGQRANGEQSLGVLLVDLLRLYGRAFNNQDVGVSLKNGFMARAVMECDNENSSRWVVEDPADTANNLAGGSYGIFKVRQAFDYAYQALIAPKAAAEELLLSRVVRLDPVMWARRPDNNPFTALATTAFHARHDARAPAKKRSKKHGKKRDRDDSSMSISSGSAKDSPCKHKRGRQRRHERSRQGH